MSSPQNFTFNRYTLTLDRPGIVLPAELNFDSERREFSADGVLYVSLVRTTTHDVPYRTASSAVQKLTDSTKNM
jgi:hypothetical protein